MVRIILVDNAVDAMAPLALAFAGEAVVFEQCFSVDQALNRLRQRSFDLVVTEMHESGEEIASRVAACAFAHDLMTQVIVFAAHPPVRASVELMKMGVFDVIEKGRGFDDLVEVIRSAMHQAHRDRELVMHLEQN